MGSGVSAATMNNNRLSDQIASPPLLSSHLSLCIFPFFNFKLVQNDHPITDLSMWTFSTEIQLHPLFKNPLLSVPTLSFAIKPVQSPSGLFWSLQTLSSTSPWIQINNHPFRVTLTCFNIPESSLKLEVALRGQTQTFSHTMPFCSWCYAKFGQECEVKEHQKPREGLKCPYCGALLTNHCSFRSHMEYKHPE